MPAFGFLTVGAGHAREITIAAMSLGIKMTP